MTRDKKAKKVRIFFSESNQLAFRFRMAREIKAIRKKLDAINADRQNFHLEVRRVEPHESGTGRGITLILWYVRKQLLVERMIRRLL
jgi:hypothetical protein